MRKKDKQEKERIKKEQEMEARINAEFAANKQKWFQDNGFNTETEVTYIYFPSDSYAVKEELKAAGFKFNPNLFWHRDNATGYEDKVIEVAAAQVMELSAWGKGMFFANAKSLVQDLMQKARPVSTSEWVAAEKDKVSNLKVTLFQTGGFDGAYGWTNIYKFKTEKGNILVWFTAKDLLLEKDSVVLLSGTVKKLQEYDGIKETILIRCRISEVE